MKARIVLLAALFAAVSVLRAEESFNIERAKEIYAKSQRGESLTDEEQKYLEGAKRQVQQRTGMSEEQINKLRALHEKSQRGESLTAEEQKMLDDAKAKAGAATASGNPPAKDGFDWERAKGLHQRVQAGETLSADDQKFYDEAKRRFEAGQGPRGGGSSGGDPDMQRARQIYEKKQKGESLTAEEQKILDEAMKRRGGGGGSGGAASSAGASGQPVADAALLKELVPLTELTASYKGRDGGLYGAGKNEPPASQQELAKKAIAQIKPLNAEGKPDAAGKIVLMSIGMSNTTMEFSGFAQKINEDPRKAPAVIVVDSAQGGKDATAWATADAQPWKVAEERLRASKVTPQQVQAIFIKQALIGPQAAFPAEADRLRARLTEIVQLAKQKYPNLRLAFISSRTYAGFATTRLNPEPHAYESAFAVRDLIQQQISGDAALNADPAKGLVKAPVLLWGPYLWAAGTTPRKADGFTYTNEDVGQDGTHPSQSGRAKIAKLIEDFFTSDANAKPWFVK